MEPINQILIHNQINDVNLWHGIADSHDTFPYMLCELCDDSISSMIANKTIKRKIIITLIEQKNLNGQGDLLVSIEDSGAGVKNLDACMTYSSSAGAETPLNRYGVALKKILATFDPENVHWALFTRTEKEFSQGEYRHVQAPYRTNGMMANICQNVNQPWPGVLEGTGTYVCFPCSRPLFNTSGKGYPGHDISFIALVQCIKEELAVIYAPYLRDGFEIILHVQTAEAKVHDYFVQALEPIWCVIQPPDVGKTTVDLGNGPVQIKYHFGQIENHPRTMRYFRKSFSNSGVMLYENKRLIEHNIFSAIWGKEHPQYNGFLAVIELDVPEGGSDESLPPPVPTKDKLFFGDYRLAALYKWIHSHCPRPAVYKSGPQPKPEVLLCEKLASQFRTQYGSEAKVLTQMPVYDFIIKSPPLIDIYLFTGTELTLFECKLHLSHEKDVFQLIMYHLGALHDGLVPNKLVLLAEKHSYGTVQLARYLNTCKDTNGNLYRIELKRWQDYGMSNILPSKERLLQ